MVNVLSFSINISYVFIYIICIYTNVSSIYIYVGYIYRICTYAVNFSLVCNEDSNSI